MSQPSPTIVKQAVEHFRKGNYPQARRHYQQAAHQYGHHLFANSIRLCELRMASTNARPPQDPGSASSTQEPAQAPATARSASNIDRQLEDTQQLLEHYFARCQELEYQLMDR